MSSLINAPAAPQRKTRRPARSVRVLEPASSATDGWAAIRITVDRDSTDYLLRRIPCEFGSAAFELEKLDADLEPVEVYHLHTDHGMTNCDCRGHEAHGHCKHASALAVLEARGQLPEERYLHVCDHCGCELSGGGLCDDCALLDAARSALGLQSSLVRPPDDCPF